MRKKTLYKIKKRILKKINSRSIDINSINLLKSIGFTITYDNDDNFYIWDNLSDERMYINTLSIAGIPYRSAENSHHLLEFTIVNKHIEDIKLYEKEDNYKNSYKLIYKK